MSKGVWRVLLAGGRVEIPIKTSHCHIGDLNGQVMPEKMHWNRITSRIFLIAS